MVKYIKLLFEHEDHYFEPVKVINFWNNNYIE